MEPDDKQFADYVAAYGANGARWPAALQDLYRQQSATAAGQLLLAEAGQIDQLLAPGMAETEPGAALMARLYAIPTADARGLTAWERRTMRGFMAAASVCALVGVIGGWQVGAAGAPPDELVQLGLYLFGAGGLACGLEGVLL